MRKIIHIDADCFFASVELRRRPHLLSKPFAVGGSPEGRGVITTCNYMARSFGVRSAMASSHALRLCPDLHFVRPEMSLYKRASQQMFDIFRRYTDKVETVSIDEAYLDVTDVSLFHGSATLIAQDIQRCVKTELDLPVSAGIASVKFLAKIASDWNKPEGIFTISPEAATDFIAALPLNRLPGVGPRTYDKLKSYNLQTCQDVRSQDKVFLAAHFGAFGLRLLQMSEGVDTREVKNTRSRKSLSVEHTFEVDIADKYLLLDQLEPLLAQLSERYQLMKKRQQNLAQTDLPEPEKTAPSIDLQTNDLGHSVCKNSVAHSSRRESLGECRQDEVVDESNLEVGDSKPLDLDGGKLSLLVEADHTDNRKEKRGVGADMHLAEDALAGACATSSTVRLPPSSRLSVSKYIVKLKFSDFTHTTIETGAKALTDEQEYEAFCQLLLSARKRSHLPVRLLGVGYKFASADSLRQLDLPFSEK